MKFLNLVFISTAVLFSSEAFALTYNCESDAGTDSFSRITLFENGSLEVQFYEFQTELPKSAINVQTASTYDNVDTHLTIANNVMAKYSVEGHEGEASTTVIFVYNPTQNAGRLTFVQDGRTYARNKLYTNCN